LWQHQNTQTHVGNQAYPFGNPKYSLENNAFLSSELVEAVRRTHNRMAGMHNFSSITWFQNVYDAKRVKPYPTYYRMKNSLNPVLISAELWGRHFYAGEKLPTRFCIVNDKVDGETLASSVIKWEISYNDNRTVSSGTIEVPKVDHNTRKWISPEIGLPESFDGERLKGKLRLFLSQNGSSIAYNEYEILVAKKGWITNENSRSKNIVLVDFTSNTCKVLKSFNYDFKQVDSIKMALNQKADLYIISGLYKEELSQRDIALINQTIKNGSKVLFLNAGSKAMDLFPGHITGYVERPGETAHMDIEESGIFNGIEYMELRYFNNNKAEKPLVYNGLLQTAKLPEITAVSSACQHRYARGKDRRAEMLRMKGFPIVTIENGGKVILSEMITDKGLYDPVAAKLLSNMIDELVSLNFN
jgi:hypothetical protein